MDKLQLGDQWEALSILFPYLQGGWGSAEAHTGRLGLFPVSNWKKALDKMKAHKASAWYKMAKAKVEAEKQSQAEGSVILQLKQGKERCNEQMKQQNRILIKKLLRIMYFLCKQKIAHFSNFDEVVQLMVANGDDEVRKHLDTAPRNANYGSHVAISEYLDAISLWVQQGILRSLKEAAFYSILADESTDIATIEELSICFRWVDSSGSPVEHFLGLVSLSAPDAASIFAALKAFLADIDIDAGKLRGQGYDGAATFSGTKNGVQMRIRTLAPRALFVQYRRHVLQLCCISAARCLPNLKKVFATLMSV